MKECCGEVVSRSVVEKFRGEVFFFSRPFLTLSKGSRVPLHT